MDQQVRHALKWVLIWFSLAMLCCLGIFFVKGSEFALQFLGGYLIEFSLSMDNLFVFITVFTAFRVPVEYQHRVLAYGIAGAVILRLIFISLGVTIVNSFTWVLYIFGFVLILSGIKMFRQKEDDHVNTKNHIGLRVLRKIMPVTEDYHGNKFFVKENGKMWATPLFAVLMIIEFSDILFAIDSVPAVFSVSTDLFVVYTSNIFAILGLRQLYFVLEHLQSRFAYVKYGVATILTFTGVKLAGLMFDFHISIVASISIIFAVLLISIVGSMLVTKKNAEVVVEEVETETSVDEKHDVEKEYLP